MDENGVYLGEKAQAEWEALGCTTPLPIETDTGLQGMDNGHWDEFCLRRELMTGILQEYAESPLSRITIAGLEDLGYTVNYDNADEYTIDDVVSSCCIPEPERRLRAQSQSKPAPSYPDWTEEMLSMARAEALRVLSSLREAQDAAANSPDNVVSLSGDLITVLVYDDEGNVRQKTFRWDQVSDQLIAI